MRQSALRCSVKLDAGGAPSVDEVDTEALPASATTER
jgi:hypothetical protein